MPWSPGTTIVLKIVKLGLNLILAEQAIGSLQFLIDPIMNVIMAEELELILFEALKE